jgi:hypothetical protein
MRRILPIALLPLAGGCQYEIHEVPPPEPFTEMEIIRLSKEGVPPNDIIAKIRDSRTVYILDAKDVVRLHETGVDDKVIDYMLATQRWAIENRARLERSTWYGPYWGPYPPPPGFGWYVW